MTLGAPLRAFRVRLALAATAIAVVVGALLTIVTVVRSMRAARDSLETAGRNGAEHLASDVVLGVLVGDRADVARAVRSYRAALPDVVSVTVYRGWFGFASEGERPPPGGPIPAMAVGELREREAAGGLLFQVPVVLQPSPSDLAVSPPRRPEVIGVAEVVLSLDGARDRVRTTVLLHAVLLSLGAVVAVLLSFLSARRLARPIQRLTRAAEEVAAGRLDVAVPVHAHDELGLLTERFNRMVQALRRASAEQARNERELRGHAQALREADRRKDEFLAMLAHELRNPLAPISNAAYVLDRLPPGSEGARRALEVLQRQVRHMARLVDDLLDVSRIQRGKITLRCAELDLVEVVRRTVQDYRSVFASAGVALELELPRLPLVMDGDETRLAQILGNLLQNAAKFTPEAGRTTVVLSAHDDMAELRVRDTGAGIDPSIRARLFQPFEQADRSLARTTGGLGLGLALVKGLVELHRGTVEARCGGEGQGAEFVVVLPVGCEGAVRPRSRTAGEVAAMGGPVP